MAASADVLIQSHSRGAGEGPRGAHREVVPRPLSDLPVTARAENRLASEREREREREHCEWPTSGGPFAAPQ